MSFMIDKKELKNLEVELTKLGNEITVSLGMDAGISNISQYNLNSSTEKENKDISKVLMQIKKEREANKPAEYVIDEIDDRFDIKESTSELSLLFKNIEVGVREDPNSFIDLRDPVNKNKGYKDEIVNIQKRNRP